MGCKSELAKVRMTEPRTFETRDGRPSRPAILSLELPLSLCLWTSRFDWNCQRKGSIRDPHSVGRLASRLIPNRPKSDWPIGPIEVLFANLSLGPDLKA